MHAISDERMKAKISTKCELKSLKFIWWNHMGNLEVCWTLKFKKVWICFTWIAFIHENNWTSKQENKSPYVCCVCWKVLMPHANSSSRIQSMWSAATSRGRMRRQPEKIKINFQSMSIKLELMHHPYNGVRGGKRGEFLDVGGMGKFPLFRFYRCSVVTYGKRETLSWKQSALRLTPSTATHLIHNHSLLAHRMWKYSALLMKLFVKYSTMLKFDVGRNWMRKTCLNTVIIVFNHLLTYSTKFKNVKIISGGICDECY